MSFAYQERVISYTALYILQFIIFLIFERSRYKKKKTTKKYDSTLQSPSKLIFAVYSLFNSISEYIICH